MTARCQECGNPLSKNDKGHLCPACANKSFEQHLAWLELMGIA